MEGARVRGFVSIVVQAELDKERKKERGLIAFLDGQEDKDMHDGSMSGQRTNCSLAYTYHSLLLSSNSLFSFPSPPKPPNPTAEPPKKTTWAAPHPVPTTLLTPTANPSTTPPSTHRCPQGTNPTTAPPAPMSTGTTSRDAATDARRRGGAR